MVSRPNARGFDVGDLPTITAGESGTELSTGDGMRSNVVALVTEAQDIKAPAGRGDLRKTRNVSSLLVRIEGVKEPTVHHGVEFTIESI